MNNENKIRTFTDLNTWKEAHKLVLAIYEETKNFPKEIENQLVICHKLINALIKKSKILARAGLDAGTI